MKKYGTIPHAVYGVTPGAIPSCAVHPGALHAYRILGPGDQDLAPTNIIGTKKIDRKDPIKIHNVSPLGLSSEATTTKEMCRIPRSSAGANPGKIFRKLGKKWSPPVRTIGKNKNTIAVELAVPRSQTTLYRSLL